MSSENFLECKKKYGKTALPVEGHSLAPWVRITFTGNNIGVINSITVGNKSDNEYNTAVIKDFEFAGSDGLKIRVTIHDQKGGSFAKFMESLVKDSKCLKVANVRMKFEWGWARNNCKGNMAVSSAIPHYAIPKEIECNFSGGKFMFSILATDIGSRMLEGRTKDSEGDDGNAIPFEDALTNIFINGCGPKISEVGFINKNGKEGICWKVKDNLKHSNSDDDKCEESKKIGSKKGAIGVFNFNNKDKLQAANDMLSRPEGITINDRSCTLMYDSTVPSGKIIIQEIKKPNPGDSNPWKELSIGKTYIVNGGKESPVLEFNPRINWSFYGLQSTGGEAGTNSSSSNQDGGEAKGDNRSKTLVKPYIECMGTEISGSIDRNVEDRERERAEVETMQSETQHEKGLKLLHSSIEADLVIIGDPTLPPPLEIIQRVVGIIFINPYHIQKSNKICGKWITGPTCNEVLSNRAWFIKHVTHKISPGSYTTVLRLELLASGVDIECNDPLGGIGSGGWQPKCCL